MTLVSLAITSSSLWISTSLLVQVEANPKSRPYVAYRGNPFDQEIVTRRILEDGVEQRGAEADGYVPSNTRVMKNNINKQAVNRRFEDDPRCPLSFRLGTTHSTHLGSATNSESPAQSHRGVGVHTPPIIYPLHPDFDAGSGRQILLTTDYEMLEMFTPSNAIGTHTFDFTRKDRGNPNGGDVGVQSTEQMKEDEQFPLLFESSSFYHSSPIVHDIEGDGVADAILGDYDGNLHFVGLDFELQDAGTQRDSTNQRRKRYYKRISIPRLFVRKSWYDVAINRTREDESMALVDETVARQHNHTSWEEFEPYHTYFAGISDTAWKGPLEDVLLRGVTGDVLNMDVDLSRQLAENKNRRWQGGIEQQSPESPHRRLEEVEVNIVENLIVDQGNNGDESEADMQPASETEEMDHLFEEFNYREEDPELFGDDSMGAPPDGAVDSQSKDSPKNWGDDYFPSNHEDPADGDTAENERMDDYHRRYAYGDDAYQPQAPDGYESYQQYQEVQNKYYHDSNYLRLPPHLLSTCALVELPRPYSSASTNPIDRIDELLLCAVSYYFDEDESRDPSRGGKSFGKHANADGGDETEEQRGRYVANAILGYNMRWKYWMVQEVLDLSTDHSAPLGDIVNGGTAPNTSDSYNGMGAFALATPIAVNLDGGDRNHIIVGTSMGLVYALDVSWHNSRKGWPVQMRHPVEQMVLVEDVVGDTNLEVFVVDSGGDLVSLDANGEVLWARNILRKDDDGAEDVTVSATGPMSLGDVEGTGELAIVLLAKITTSRKSVTNRPGETYLNEYRLYAINAITSDDLPHFPISLGSGSFAQSSHSMPQPLLVDLHQDQRYWLDHIHGMSEEEKNEIRAINRNAVTKGTIDGSSPPRLHGGNGRGLHIVQPLGHSLHIIEGSTSCSQTIDVGDDMPSAVMADDVHGTGGLDLVVSTSQGEILTLESDVVPYHPLNVWSAGVFRSPGSNARTHGFSSKQGIFVHHISRQFRDILGIYVPITFEIFDRRPNINNQLYRVDIRAGMSAKRTIFSYSYNTTGVFTERVQIPFGPGYYSISVRLLTTHGIVYEDTFHIGFNVNYMGGLWLIVCMPLVLATFLILIKVRKPDWEEDEDYGGRGMGILGRTPPP